MRLFDPPMERKRELLAEGGLPADRMSDDEVLVWWGRFQVIASVAYEAFARQQRTNKGHATV